MAAFLADEALVDPDPETSSGPPMASFWLGDSRLRVIAAEALQSETATSVVGELVLSDRRFIIVKQERSSLVSTNAVDLLTRRELQIALLVAAGKVNKQIAHRLGISSYTVSSYLKRIFLKLNCRTRAEMAAQVIETMGPKRSSDVISS